MAENTNPDAQAGADKAAADKAAEDADARRPARRESGLSTADRDKMMADAMERERAAGRSTDDLGDADREDDFLWVHSNRHDDRTVLMETGEPAHPGGQAFVGGQGVAKVGRSAEVERLLYTGELIEVPEPPRTVKDHDGKDIPNPHYPVVGSGSGAPPITQQPGQPILLGRTVDPVIWGGGDDGRKVVQDVRRRQKAMPSAINPAPGGITPPGMPGTPSARERETRSGAAR